MTRAYIGIDNGVTGSVGIITPEETFYFKTPTIKQLSYTKTKQNISRLDFLKMKDILVEYSGKYKCRAIMERPMVNPGRFKAGISAVRCLEATLILLELLEIPYSYCDSKEWQKALLPAGIKGPPELKAASADIGMRLFPECEEMIVKQKDADGLLIAEWARRMNL